MFVCAMIKTSLPSMAHVTHAFPTSWMHRSRNKSKNRIMPILSPILLNKFQKHFLFKVQIRADYPIFQPLEWRRHVENHYKRHGILCIVSWCIVVETYTVENSWKTLQTASTAARKKTVHNWKTFLCIVVDTFTLENSWHTLQIPAFSTAARKKDRT